MSNDKKPTIPFVLSLVAGILTLIGGLTVAYVGLWRFEFMGRVMRRYGYAFAAGPGYFCPFLSLAGMLGIILGLILIAGAIMLNRRPAQHTTWGILILIFSILGLFGGMGGYLIGLILGIVGGALAIAWRGSLQRQLETAPRRATRRPGSHRWVTQYPIFS